MHQTIHQHRIAASAISLGFMTVFLSLVQPIPPASAQQLIRPINQDTGGTGTQGQRIENGAGSHQYSTKPAEKMDSQTSTHKSHRLIRKPQNLPLASVEPSLSDSSSVNSVPSSPLSLQRDGTTAQPEEPSVSHRGIGAAVPLAPISVTPSAAPPSGFTATGTAPTSTIPLAAAGVGNSASSGGGRAGGRTMQRLSAEMSGVAQLVSPPSAPALSDGPVTGGPAIGINSINLSFTAQQGGASPAAQTLTINNIGHGTLNWTASGSAAWLSLSPTSGTGAGMVTANVLAGALAPGSYSETIILSASGATPITIPVSFTVTAAPVPPTISASPTSLAFTAIQGGSNPAAQTLSISNTGDGTSNWSVSHDATWLAHTPGTGTGTGTVTISVLTGSLTVGAHSGRVTVWPRGSTATPVTIPISFTVTAAPVPPTIGASPTSLAFTAIQGGSNPAAQTLSIRNTGGGTLTWNASETTGWLTLTAGSGSGNGTMTLQATTGALAVGNHTGTVTLSGGTGVTPVAIPVSFTVTTAPVPPTIGASPTSLSYTVEQGTGNPAAQTLSITNRGGGTLTWSVTGNSSWISPSPASGIGSGGTTISVTTGFLAAGTYNGTITLSATGVSSVTVPVTFTVTPRGGTATTTVNLSPSSLSYTATQGAANPINQDISLTNTGGILNWAVSDDASWLTVNPASGSGSRTLSTSVNTAGLTAGTYHGTLTVSAAGISPKAVAVTLTVNASATSSVTLTWNANTESDLSGYKIYRATTSGGYGAPIATLQGNIPTFIASGLQLGTTYYFVVTAYDSAGNESSLSNEVNKSIY